MEGSAGADQRCLRSHAFRCDLQRSAALLASPSRSSVGHVESGRGLRKNGKSRETTLLQHRPSVLWRVALAALCRRRCLRGIISQNVGISRACRICRTPDQRPYRKHAAACSESCGGVDGRWKIGDSRWQGKQGLQKITIKTTSMPQSSVSSPSRSALRAGGQLPSSGAESAPSSISQLQYPTFAA